MSPRHLLTVALAAALALPTLGLASPAVAQSGSSAREQRETLEAGGLPAAADLGSGWTLGSADTVAADDGPGVDVYEAYYADRYGTRIAIYSAPYDRSTEDAALEVASFLVQSHAAALEDSDLAPTARELRDLDDPDGCDAVDRATGEDPIGRFFVGTLSCQDTANDRVLVVSVSGNYDGDTFQDAAESVLGIVLEIAPGGEDDADAGDRDPDASPSADDGSGDDEEPSERAEPSRRARPSDDGDVAHAAA